MDKKLTEGMSVQELENFGKKYRFEIFFVLYFILATISSFLNIIFSQGWSISLGALGGILGIWLPNKIEGGGRSCFGFIFKQEKATKIILGVGGLILSFIIAPIIFFVLGLMGGSGIFRAAAKAGKPHEE